MNQIPAISENPEQPAQQAPPAPEAPKKKPRQSIALKPQHFEQKNGLELLYKSIEKLDLTKAEDHIETSMSKIMNVLKTWHFEMLPRYSLDYFLQRCKALGNQKLTQVKIFSKFQSYMHKVRKIHKGYDQWDSTAEQHQAQNGQQPQQQAIGDGFMNQPQHINNNNDQTLTIEQKMQRALQIVNGITGATGATNANTKQQSSLQQQNYGQSVVSPGDPPLQPQDDDQMDQCQLLFKQMDAIQKERKEILQGTVQGTVQKNKVQKIKQQQKSDSPLQQLEEQPYVPEGFDIDYDQESYE